MSVRLYTKEQFSLTNSKIVTIIPAIYSVATIVIRVECPTLEQWKQ